MIIDQKVRIIRGPHTGAVGTVAFFYPQDNTIVVKVAGNMLAVSPHEAGDEAEWQQTVSKMAYERFLWRCNTQTPGSALDDWTTAESGLYLIQKVHDALAA